MYIFTIRTDKKQYKKYNGKECWVSRNPVRVDGYVEVYVLEYGDFILVRPSELED